MSGGRQSWSWITSARDDQEAVKAIILARSLKQSLSRVPALVFVAPAVSDDFVSLLEDEFQRCISMTNKKCGEFGVLSFATIAFIHSYSLTYLKKFAFLDCNSLVVKNADELFNTVGRAGKEDELGLVVGVPSSTLFRNIISQLKSGRVDFQDENVIESLVDGNRLADMYSIPMKLDGSPLIRNINEIKILQFESPHPIEIIPSTSDSDSKIDAFGPFEKKAYSFAHQLLNGNGLGKNLPDPWKNTNPTKLSSLLRKESLEELQDSVAIVGMSFRFPGANNLEEFWSLLSKGEDGIIKIPDLRWTDDECSGKLDSCKEGKAGYLKCPIDQMDSKFFGLSPAELASMDPQQRLTLQVTWEALEHSGIDPLSLKNTSTGVFGGWWRNDYVQWLDTSSDGEFLRGYLATSLGSLAGRISHMLDTTGPSIATESGCSTSMVGMDMACKNLRADTCDIALAFGVNLLFRNASIKNMPSLIASDGRCKTFDAEADGFGRAEGCAVLVLKRFPDALRDGDRVWGVVRGSAMVQEGPSRSMGTPTVHCEALAMRLALEDAGVEAKDVSFVETHGTGTPVGDPIEVSAMAEVYSKGRTEILTIGSVKTNIGHTESCAGLAGIIKTLLSLKNEIIPPHVNFKNLNSKINLNSIPAQLPLTPLEWKRNPNGKARIAGISSFGITGTDAHLILQETPTDLPSSSALQLSAAQPLEILKLSAKTEESLGALVESYTKFLETTPEALADICFTANCGRSDFPFRSATVCSSKSELLQKLGNPLTSNQLGVQSAPKICFLFTGQGSQYLGMARALYDNCPTFQMHFDSCDTLLKNRFDISIKDAMWGDMIEELSRTIYSQTSIFCVEYCLLKLWESWGVKPDIVLGHSLGEFGAAVAAGILKFTDALVLVAERSRLIDSLPGGKMLVIKETEVEVASLLNKAFRGTDKWLDFAAVNSPDQTVVAGSEESVREFADFCGAQGLKTHILDATHAFHSRHMDPMLSEYREIASNINYYNPTCTFISGMEGRRLEDTEVDSDYWVRHTRQGVQFISASKSVLKEGESPIFLEVGPHPVLSALTLNNSNQPLTCLPSLRKKSDEWSTILTTLGTLYTKGVEVNWWNVHQYSPRNRVTLPYYPFQNKAYWFESKEQIQRPIHPLLGVPLSSPSCQKIFQSSLDLNKHLYLKDHEIGNQVIFPMAGFLEMCIVAGHSAVLCIEGDYNLPTAPLTIQNFQVEGSLGMTLNSNAILQTIVSTEDASGEARVTVHSKISLDKKNQKWIRHASGVFLPYALKISNDDNNNLGSPEEELEVVRQRCRVKDDRIFYDKYWALGLKLGPSFRTSTEKYKGEDGESFNVIELTQNSDGYVLHPVVIDAMIQAQVFADTTPNPTSFSVPISINKFVLYSRIEKSSSYIYVDKRSKGDLRSIILYDEFGKILARMVGLTLIETTVSSIMSALEAQKTSLPPMYKEVWRDSDASGWDSNSAWVGDLNDLFPQDFIRKTNKEFESFNEADGEFFELSDQLYLMFIINGLYYLGFEPSVGQVYDLTELFVSLRVQSKYMGLFRAIITELGKEGYLEMRILGRHSLEFEVISPLPSKEEVKVQIDSLQSSPRLANNIEILALSSTGLLLGPILRGLTDPLPILFPGDTSKVGPVEAYYQESLKTKISGDLSRILFGGSLFRNVSSTGKGHCKILEIGSGTGALTRLVLPHLKHNPSSYDYTFTDISSTFFHHGQKIFQDSRINVKYKTLDLEVDPLSQGFVPHQYDFIFAGLVVHATKDIRESMSHLRNLLKPGGILVLGELVKSPRDVNLVFGMLDGYWRFTDKDLRPWNCEISYAKWDLVCKELNFVQTVSFTFYDASTAFIFAQASQDSTYVLYKNVSIEEPVEKKSWILFDAQQGEFGQNLGKRLESMGRRIFHVRRSRDNSYRRLTNLSFEIRTDQSADMETVFGTITRDHKLEGVVYLWGLDEMLPMDYRELCEPFLYICKNISSLSKVKLLSYTRGLINIGDEDLSSPTASLIIGMSKTVCNEMQSVTCKYVDLDMKESVGNNETEVDQGVREIFIDDSEPQVAYRNNRRHLCRLGAYKVAKTSLALPRSDHFQIILPQSNSISDLKFVQAEPLVIEGTEVEVQVISYALNFRDILNILKPDSQFQTMTNVGIDFAGIVTSIGPHVLTRQVGDRVFGMIFDGKAVPSYIQLSEDNALPIPENMTFNEASTLPTVTITALVCLLKLAKLKDKETVLIHAGSGGVGFCAIKIAQSLNCNIITTAGSCRKRAFLKNLGIQHVFNSRDTTYKDKIVEALGGNLVDVVLNSLTSPGFKEASLQVCKPGARFIEMSKLNTWTEEEVKSLRPDVNYQIIDISIDLTVQSRVKALLEEMQSLITNSIVKPLPYVRFDVSDIREGLNYLQKAKHIGKVVCVMPEKDHKTLLFNDRSTYLITGGLGGIGIEVAKWMTTSGAKYIALVGRSQPSDHVTQEIKKLNSEGLQVFSVQLDIGDYDACRLGLQELKSMNVPPLRGVMHAAGVLSDAAYINQTWANYEKVYNAKVKGGWNLHELTLSYPLEHFVMFSSCTANFGPVGQSNHVSANSFLDSLANYRHFLGLPATTINWGQWGQVGVAASLEVNGFRPFTVLQGISALDRVMRTLELQVMVAEADVGSLRRFIPSCRNTKYLEEVTDANEGSKDFKFTVQRDEFWIEYESSSNKLEVAKKYTILMIQPILKMDEVIEDTVDFQDIGLDSLMMIELKNSVQTLFGDRAQISMNTVKDCNNVAQLASRIVELASVKLVHDLEAPPTPEEFQKLIRQDIQLPLEIYPQGQSYCKASEIRTVLITGVSGNLGPYVLRELSRRPQIEKIYCLLRPTPNISSQERLLSILNEKKLSQDIRLEILEAVTGTIAEQNLALPQELFSKLSQEVDAVVHLAVKADNLDIYRVAQDSTTDMRTVNVIGTLNVLDFACKSKPKHVYHASSIAAVVKVDQDQNISEEFSLLEDAENMPNMGYPVSKAIADALMEEAIKRGLPCKVFRLPNISGDSRTGGNVSAIDNILMHRFMAYLHMGIVPDNSWTLPLMLLPVDVCAELSVQVFLDDEAGYEVYNVFNPYANEEQDLLKIAEDLGYPELKVVEAQEFYNRLDELEDSKLFYFMKRSSRDRDMRYFLKSAVPWLSNSKGVFLSKKLSRLVPQYPESLEWSLDILKRDLLFAKQSGVFSKLGLTL